MTLAYRPPWNDAAFAEAKCQAMAEAAAGLPAATPEASPLVVTPETLEPPPSALCLPPSAFPP